MSTPKIKNLTLKQLKVVKLIADGQSVKNISDDLGISSRVIYLWLKNSDFIKAVYSEYQSLNIERSRIIRNGYEKAANFLVDSLDDEFIKPGLKVQVAIKLIDINSKLLDHSFQFRLAEVEEYMKELNELKTT